MEEKTICRECEYVMPDLIPFVGYVYEYARCRKARKYYVGRGNQDYRFCEFVNEHGNCKDFKKKESAFSWFSRLFGGTK